MKKKIAGLSLIISFMCLPLQIKGATDSASVVTNLMLKIYSPLKFFADSDFKFKDFIVPGKKVVSTPVTLTLTCSDNATHNARFTIPKEVILTGSIYNKKLIIDLEFKNGGYPLGNDIKIEKIFSNKNATAVVNGKYTISGNEHGDQYIGTAIIKAETF